MNNQVIGIYRIKNFINNKVYVGSSVNIKKRLAKHIACLRQKMSGPNNPNYGKHPSEETKQRMSESAVGRKASEETKRRMSESKMGHEVSKETRKRIGDRNRGVLKDKPLQEKHRRHIKEALSLPDVKEKMSRPETDETKLHLSESHRGQVS